MPTRKSDNSTPTNATDAIRDHIRVVVGDLCNEDWGNSPAQIGGVCGPATALTVCELARAKSRPVFLLFPGSKALDDLRLDLLAFDPKLPLIEIPFSDFAGPSGATGAADWMPVLGRLLDLPRDQAAVIVCASVQSLLSPLPDERRLKDARIAISKGQNLPPAKLAAQLQSGGFEPVAQIEYPAQFSRRGGVFDLWPASEPQPIRLEYFGDEVESIRLFDPATQRSTVSVAQIGFMLVTLNLSKDAGGKAKDRDELLSGLLNYLPYGALPVFVDRRETLVKLDGMKPFLRASDQKARFEAVAEFVQSVPRVDLLADAVMKRRGARQLGAVAYAPRAGGMERAAEAIAELLGDHKHLAVCAGSEGEASRLRSAMESHGIRADAIEVLAHEISGSLRLPTIKAALLSGADLLGKHRLRAGVTADEQSAARVPHRAIEDFIRLETGDYVVHAAYGIAKFHGISEVRAPDGSRGEFMRLEFAGGTEVQVPVANADAVQKYIGAGGLRPQLSEYRSKSWSERRAKVQEAVLKLAGEMLRIQALRQTETGFACPKDDPVLHDFVESFPFRDTPDQERGWAEITRDMESPRPMDRLVCGDVGFGKTELAMRACMKAVLAGRQAGVLVPTTVLAQQHFLTFCERFKGHPISIDYLSRFKSAKAQKEVLQRLKEGRLDIVIGTHRLLSKDVEFRDLGLLVIDEEQRFGVANKEAVKRMRHTVDVLTLSATPIPRTLHMALLGIRDISSLTTPPEHRHPVETILTPWSDIILRDALESELARGGQIYVVHNKIGDIEMIAGRVRSLVPQARIAVGHGQMKEGELEKVMLAFIRHEIDVLVSTTIIESGIDVPSANTMLIDQAQNYGLADLHQLRGRVGRHLHRAHCYLLVPSDREVSEVATKRLRAIVEHHMLGSGFHIAMRDLELRGAGNIIGTEQSGFIATVGYDLYCQMLERAVKMLRGERVPADVETKLELGLDTVIPRAWVRDPAHRIEVYRKIGRAKTATHADALKVEFADRFGKVPKEVEVLLQASIVRHRLGRLGVSALAVGRVQSDLPAHFRMKCVNPHVTCELLRKGAPGFRVLDEATVVFPMHRGMEKPLDQLRYLFNLLQTMVARGHLDEERIHAIEEAA